MKGSVRARRGLAVLLAGGLLTGIAVVGPATGASKPLTKSKANKLFVNVGEKASDADELDGKDSTEFGPVAYAHVYGDGTLDTANSKNVVATSRPMIGYYCIDVAVPFKNIQVTEDGYDNSAPAGTTDDPYVWCAPNDPGQATGDATVSLQGQNSDFWILFN